MFSKQSKKEVQLAFSLLWEIHSKITENEDLKSRTKKEQFQAGMLECTNRRLHQTDLLTVIIMSI